MARNIDIVSEIRDLKKLFSRSILAKRDNNSNKKAQAPNSKESSRERMSEREFVRSFGTKVKKVRYSNRADFVGLMILGVYQGFVVTGDEHGKRKVRLIDIDEKGVTRVTQRYLPVRDKDTISNLQRGLLKWVR